MDNFDHTPSDTTQWSWLAPRVGGFLPDFLIISPPKTGSTWLAYNLRCHPQVFITESKEVKYFSSYYKWFDLNWYVRHFQADASQLKGEASPSYSILPQRTIRRLHALLPGLKLIFLMRDPVERAWSHAKHNHRYNEANFHDYSGTIESVPDERWQENFRHPWPYQSGDYLGQLQRWLAVFPREQMYVDFYERIASDPIGLLTDVFGFLGVRTDHLDWSAFPVHQTIFAGVSRSIPPQLKHDLGHLLHHRTAELAALLHERLGMSVGDRWGDILTPQVKDAVADDASSGNGLLPVPAAPFTPTIDDAGLDQLLEQIDFNQPRLVEEGYFGYNIVFHQRRFFLLQQTPENIIIDRLTHEQLQAMGYLVQGESLQSAHDTVAHNLIGHYRDELFRTQRALNELKEQLAAGRAHTDEVRSELSAKIVDLAEQLLDCQIFVSRIRESWLFTLRRRLAQWCRGLLRIRSRQS